MVLRGDRGTEIYGLDSPLPFPLYRCCSRTQVPAGCEFVNLTLSRLFVQGPNTGEPSVPPRKGRVIFFFFFLSPYDVPFHGRENKSRRLLKTESGGRVSLLRGELTRACVRVEGKREYIFGAQQICGEWGERLEVWIIKEKRKKERKREKKVERRIKYRQTR